MAKPFSGKTYRALDRGKSYRARGVRRRSLAEMVYFSRNDIDLRAETDAYHLIGRQLDKRMSDAKAELAETVRETVATRSFHQRRRMQSVQRRQNRAAQEVLDPEYSGHSPRSRIKGKGRSVAIGEVYKPSLELQTGAAQDQRIGSLTGSAKAPRQSSATMLSRFGANKDMSPGLLGASASRMRGAKNLMARPGTWLSRFAPFWIANEVSKGVQEWRNWDMVSFDMSNNEAKRAMGNDPINAGSVTRGILGAEVKIAAGVLSATAPIGMLLFGANEEEAARAQDLIQSYSNWAAGGFRGDNPHTAFAKAQASYVPHIENVRAQARRSAMGRFDQAITDGIVVHRDTLARRGVGGVKTVRGAYSSRPEIREARAAVGRMGESSVDMDAEVEKINRRFMGHFRRSSE